jgi:large subunit ribosomal protein L30
MAGRLRVTQVKSTIGHIARNRGTVRALGLRRIGDTVEVPDNPATRGMVRQVRFLVSVEAVAGERAARTRRSKDESAAVPAPTAASDPGSETDAPAEPPPAAEAPDAAPAAKKAPAARRASRSRKAAAESATEEGS